MRNNKLLDLTYLGSEGVYVILHNLFSNPEFFRKCYTALPQNAFTESEQRLIVGIMKDIYAKTGKVPTIDQVKEKIEFKLNVKESSGQDTKTDREEFEAIFKEIESKSDETEEDFIQIFEKFIRQQLAVKGINILMGIVSPGEKSIVYDDMMTAIKATRDTMEEAINFRWDSGDQGVFELPKDDDEILKLIYSKGRQRIPTGIMQLDNMLSGGGGIERGTVGILGAPSGFGKSTMSSIFATNAAIEGFNVLFINFEDKEPDLTAKFFATCLNLDTNRIKNPNDAEAAERLKNFIKSANCEAIKSHIKVLNPVKGKKKNQINRIDVDYLKNKVREFIEGGWEPDLIIIDYFEKLQLATSQKESIWAAQDRAMQDIEIWSQEINAAIWVTTQCKKGSYTSDAIGLDNIAGSGGKIYPCSIGMTIQRSDDNDNTRATLNLEKNRGGAVHKFTNIYINNATCQVDLSCEDVIDIPDLTRPTTGYFSQAQENFPPNW